MRYSNIILVVFIQLAFVFSITGQNVKKANKRALSYEYSEAVPVLEKIIKKNKKGKDEAIVLLADCYRLMNNEVKAAEYYALAVGQEGIAPINHYYYGQALRTLGRYEEARAQFQAYAGLMPDDSRGEIMAEYSEEIEGWLNMPAKHKAMNVASLNSPYSDFSPCFYRHGVVITTDRGAVDKSNETYEWTGKPYLGLDFARLNGVVTPVDLIYAEPALFSDDLNDNYHDGTVTFSPDGNTIYFTRTVQERVPKDEDRFSTYYLKIYSSNFDGENWSEPEEFFLNSDKYSVGHPALSPDGNCLFFASDMPDGQGGTDIYVCKKEGAGWSHAVNLGATINTAFDEMFPFMDEEKTLYFASEGHLGYGGLDIFYTTKTDENWMEPVNMMADVNSSYDDFGISTDINLGTGLFSSNRPGGIGLDDIYAFELAKKALTICGNVVDPENNPIPGATVFFLNETRSEVLVLNSDSTGRYCTEVEAGTDYTILGKKTMHMDDCTLLAIDEEAVNPNDLVLTPYELDSAYKIENIYYDLDKYYIRPDAEPPLDELVEVMRDHPINIELSSHTDCRASDAYNMELSQKRAESAVRYIVLQGVDPSRMTAKGYGETMLVNECEDGVQCTEEQHQLNRRTEFKIISIDENAEDMLDNKYHAGDVIPLREFDRDFFEECEGKYKYSSKQKKEKEPKYLKTKEDKDDLAESEDYDYTSNKSITPQEVDSLTIEAVVVAIAVVPPSMETEVEEVIVETVIKQEVIEEGIEYRVQIMANHGKSISIHHLSNTYNIPASEIKENTHNGYHIYTVGSYSTYDQAKAKSDNLRLNNGISDSFIVAFRNGERLNKL